MKRAALGIFAVLVIGIAAFWVFDPFAVAVIGDMLFGRMLGERQSPPDIAEGANFDFGWPTDPKWTRVLQRKFPNGSDEMGLKTTLRQQGFKVDDRRKTADFQWSSLPCGYTLTVGWTVNVEQRITSVTGGYSSACL